MNARVLTLVPTARRKHSELAFRLFPHGACPARWWLYAIGFEGGITKIGQTQKPRARICQHWTKVNGEVEWMHLFMRGDRGQILIVEKLACMNAEKVSERVLHSEWFRGLGRSDALCCVREAHSSVRGFACEPVKPV